jgi:hypothetical protein
VTVLLRCGGRLDVGLLGVDPARDTLRIGPAGHVSFLSIDETSQPGSLLPLPCTRRAARSGRVLHHRSRTEADREAREAAQADAQVPAQRQNRPLPPSTGR